MNTTKLVWSSPTNCTIVWLDVSAGSLSSVSVHQLASTKLELTAISWSSKRQQTWFFVQSLTRIESWSMSLSARWKAMINPRSEDWWPTRNTCLCRVRFYTQHPKVRDASECITPLSPSLTSLTYASTLWTQAPWHYTGLAVRFKDPLSIKETSNLSRHSSFFNYRIFVVRKPRPPNRQVSSRLLESCLRCFSTWLFTCMDCWRRLLSHLSLRTLLAASISTWWPIWSTRWTLWVQKKSYHSFILRSMMSATPNFLTQSSHQ